jgi:hypothetical protein
MFSLIVQLSNPIVKAPIVTDGLFERPDVKNVTKM